MTDIQPVSVTSEKMHSSPPPSSKQHGSFVIEKMSQEAKSNINSPPASGTTKRSAATKSIVVSNNVDIQQAFISTTLHENGKFVFKQNKITYEGRLNLNTYEIVWSAAASEQLSIHTSIDGVGPDYLSYKFFTDNTFKPILQFELASMVKNTLHYNKHIKVYIYCGKPYVFNNQTSELVKYNYEDDSILYDDKCTDFHLYKSDNSAMNHLIYTFDAIDKNKMIFWFPDNVFRIYKTTQKTFDITKLYTYFKDMSSGVIYHVNDDDKKIYRYNIIFTNFSIMVKCETKILHSIIASEAKEIIYDEPKVRNEKIIFRNGSTLKHIYCKKIKFYDGTSTHDNFVMIDGNVFQITADKRLMYYTETEQPENNYFIIEPFNMFRITFNLTNYNNVFLLTAKLENDLVLKFKRNNILFNGTTELEYSVDNLADNKNQLTLKEKESQKVLYTVVN